MMGVHVTIYKHAIIHTHICHNFNVGCVISTNSSFVTSKYLLVVPNDLGTRPTQCMFIGHAHTHTHIVTTTGNAVFVSVCASSPFLLRLLGSKSVRIVGRVGCICCCSGGGRCSSGGGGSIDGTGWSDSVRAGGGRSRHGFL